MLRKLFKKKEEITVVSLVAPVSGELVRLEDIPDPVFAQKMIGDGVSIQPSNNEVVAPVDGKIIQMFPSKHAVGILADNGAEILIHIGLETVNLNGEGFTAYVKEDDKIKAGDKLISFDLEAVSKKVKNMITPVIITNVDDMSNLDIQGEGEVIGGQDKVLFVEK